jgi:hypothetical protein
VYLSKKIIVIMKKYIALGSFCLFCGLSYGQSTTNNTDNTPQLQADAQHQVSPKIEAIIASQNFTPELKAVSLGIGISENDKEIIRKELNIKPPPSVAPKIAAYSHNNTK